MRSCFSLSNGLEIPCIGYGTYPLKEDLIECAGKAYDTGYRLFDTSDNYENEQYLGEALDRIKGRDNGDASNIIVISKFSQAFRTHELEQCFEESLDKLRGKLDIYLLHWPYPYLWEQQWKKMEKLYQAGRCRAIGVCNFEVPKLRRLLKICEIKPMVNQIERHPTFQQSEIADFCRRNGIQVMSYSPIARKNEKLFGDERLKGVAERYDKSIGQIVLKWNLQEDSIPIPGSRSEKHIIENISIDDFVLKDEDMKILDSMECGNRIRFAPEKRFSLKEKNEMLIYRTKRSVKKVLGIKK